MSLTDRAKRQAERRSPGWLVWLAGCLLVIRWTIRTAVAHLAFTGLLAVALLVWWAVDRGWWPWLAATTGITCLALGGWCEARPDGWTRLAGRIVARRRLHAYRRAWEDAMDGVGLARPSGTPRLLSVRLGGRPADRDTDVLRVDMPRGQLVSDWRAAVPRLVSAFADLGIRRVRCHAVPGRADLVDVHCGRARQPQAAYRGPGTPRNIDVTKPPGQDEEGQDVTDEDQQGQPPRGAFPRTPGGAR